MKTRQLSMISVGALTFHLIIDRSVLPEFGAEVNPSDVRILYSCGIRGTPGGEMRLYCLEREQWLPRPIDAIFAFFSRPENLQVITPSWLDFRMVQAPDSLDAGSVIQYCLRWHWFPIRWTTRITQWNPPFGFVDRQLSGPYALWNHQHSFSEHQGGTRMRDCVTYALPFGVVGRFAHVALVRRDVQSIFDFRAQAMRRLFPDER